MRKERKRVSTPPPEDHWSIGYFSLSDFAQSLDNLGLDSREDFDLVDYLSNGAAAPLMDYLEEIPVAQRLLAFQEILAAMFFWLVRRPVIESANYKKAAKRPAQLRSA
jgi:hypothetical protein